MRLIAFAPVVILTLAGAARLGPPVEMEAAPVASSPATAPAMSQPLPVRRAQNDAAPRLADGQPMLHVVRHRHYRPPAGDVPQPARARSPRDNGKPALRSGTRARRHRETR